MPHHASGNTHPFQKQRRTGSASLLLLPPARGLALRHAVRKPGGEPYLIKVVDGVGVGPVANGFAGGLGL